MSLKNSMSSVMAVILESQSKTSIHGEISLSNQRKQQINALNSTYPKNMISAKAGNFVENIIALDGDDYEQIRYFANNHHLLAHDNDYWCVLGTIWKSNGSTILQPLFLALFRNKERRNKHKVMKSGERREFNKLPSQVTAYRSCLNNDEVDSSISWSLDINFVEKYHVAFERNFIAEKVFSKDEIFAYFNRRGESEIIVRI